MYDRYSFVCMNPVMKLRRILLRFGQCCSWSFKVVPWYDAPQSKTTQGVGLLERKTLWFGKYQRTVITTLVYTRFFHNTALSYHVTHSSFLNCWLWSSFSVLISLQLAETCISLFIALWIEDTRRVPWSFRKMFMQHIEYHLHSQWPAVQLVWVDKFW